MKKDIETREDIIVLVDTFYAKVQADNKLAPVFIHVDWEKHLPVMYSFWSSMILGEQSYRGNPFERHKSLPIDAHHFDRWLHLFTTTVDLHFSGAKAEEIKQRAQAIAGVFQHKMKVLPAS
jgi:hemoglobin